MRRSLLALAALAAAVPTALRAEDPDAAVPSRSAPAPELPEPTMSVEAALEQSAKVEADSRAASESRLALPDADVRAREQAQTALLAHCAERPLPRWGLAIGAGFPDFGTASLVFRPLAQVRLHAGPAWNYLGWGLHGGVTLVPWSAPIAPLLSFQAGRFFGSDLSFLARGEDGAGMKPLLDEVVYSHASADVGIELGSPRGLSFSLRLGLSYVSVRTRGTASRTDEGGTVVALSNPSLNATLPSLKLGFQRWF